MIFRCLQPIASRIMIMNSLYNCGMQKIRSNEHLAPMPYDGQPPSLPLITIVSTQFNFGLEEEEAAEETEEKEDEGEEEEEGEEEKEEEAEEEAAAEEEEEEETEEKQEAEEESAEPEGELKLVFPRHSSPSYLADQ
ncbi:histone H3.v1-like [Branchiostoma floridae]|uniref:Histone H3.v1-like n=1 Tax=Branchiostoma floridae TaxID=7739 RepID=A0A9J7KPZ9_BRAFL|nr:histone H3.v1-like [Branchiostoma floridae]